MARDNFGDGVKHQIMKGLMFQSRFYLIINRELLKDFWVIRSSVTKCACLDRSFFKQKEESLWRKKPRSSKNNWGGCSKTSRKRWPSEVRLLWKSKDPRYTRDVELARLFYGKEVVSEEEVPNDPESVAWVIYLMTM